MLLMILCCAIPLIGVFVLVKVFNFNNNLLTWSIFLLCPIMHFFMMQGMHKEHKEGENTEDGQKKGDKGCH